MLLIPENLLFKYIILTFQQQQNYYRVEHKLCTCCTKKISELDMLSYHRQTQVGLLKLDNVVLFRSKKLQALTRIYKNCISILQTKKYIYN